MVKLLSYLLPLVLSISFGFGIPLQKSVSFHSSMALTDVKSNKSPQTYLETNIPSNEDIKSSLEVHPLHSSHLNQKLNASLSVQPHDSSYLDQTPEVKPYQTNRPLVKASKLSSHSKDSVIIPFKTGVQSAAIGGGVTAAAAIKGTGTGSVIATPIILKAVALPGIAAGATASLMSFPDWIAQNAKHNSNFLFQNAKTSLKDSVQDFAHLFILDASKFENLNLQDLTHESEEPIVDFHQGAQHVSQTIGTLRDGAIDLATKGLSAAKNGARVAGKLIFKPIAVVTGLHLKMLGSGLALGGRLINETGAGIAKAGSVVKLTGLGAIGMGASAVGWGLDKTTIDTHFQDSRQNCH